MRRVLLAVVFVAVCLTTNLSALRYGDTTVVVPIIARTPGAEGSLWNTELWLANPFSPTAIVTLTYYPAANPSAAQSFTTTLPPFSVRSFADVLRDQFGVNDGAGMLVMTCATTIEARARIFNSGSSVGQFGQNVPGVGLSLLSRQAYLAGLSGVDGNRLNVGVANPSPVELTLTMRITDRDNNQLTSQTIVLSPFQVVQYNDVFARFGITPRADVQVNFSTVEGQFYGYASVVRNDSGDAIFVVGTSPNS